MALFSLREYPLAGKIVLLRVDFNVPLENGNVADNNRIKATLPTIHHLVEQGCTVILLTHLGKPGGKVVSSLRLDPVATELQQLLPDSQIIKLNDCIGKDIQDRIKKKKPPEIFLLENLRFYAQEEQNNPIFAHALASLAEMYVNDAFAVSHRQHASVDTITRFLPAFAGLLMEKEITYLSKALHPERPSIWLMGGAKLDKVDLLQQALRKADNVLIGGALAFPFLKAQGIPVGLSKCSSQSVEIVQKLLQHHPKKIILPVDFVVAESFSSRASAQVVTYNRIQHQQIALDLGPETIKLFKRYLRKGQTIVWNGPLGYFEWVKFSQATKEIGRFIGSLTATSIVGGGETAEAMRKFHLDHTFTHLSTGGGAALEFLAGKTLPGIAALERSYKKFRKIYR